jgi:TRAP-type C4-dicarboxylate transport system permease small subunit
MLTKSLKSLYGFSRILVWTAGGLLIGASFLVAVDVLARRLFNMSLGGADEITGYCFAVGTSLSFAYALFERAHIRIDAFYQFMGARLRLAADLLGIVLLTAFTGVICWMAAGLVFDTFKHGSQSITPLKVPLAIPQVPWLFGWSLAFLAGVFLAAAALARLRTAGISAASELVSVKTTDEVIKEEGRIVQESGAAL